jgi:hypothetical protein
MRGARGTPFEDLGGYASLTDVAEAIQKIENNHEGVFFCVWVDPINPHHGTVEWSDAGRCAARSRAR